MNPLLSRIGIALLIAGSTARAAAPVADNATNAMAVLSARYFINLPYTDADGGVMAFTLLGGPTRGQIEYRAGGQGGGAYVPVPMGAPVSAGSWYYTDYLTATGTDSFTWRVSDGTSTSAVATMCVVLTSNTAVSISSTTNDLLVGTVRFSVWLPIVDPDWAQARLIQVVSPPAQGQLEYMSDSQGYLPVTPGTWISTSYLLYNSTGSLPGVDAFTWRATDGVSTSGAATAVLNVVSNSPPVAQDLRATATPGSNVVLSAKFSDPNVGQTFSARVVRAAQHGAVSAAGLQFTYAPAPGYTGVDSFAYVVNDGQAASAQAEARLQVRAPQDRTSNLVLLVVNGTLWPNISNEVIRLRDDLVAENYAARITPVSSTITTSNLWTYLRSEYADTNQWLCGAILIGNLPKPYLDGSNKTDLVYWNMNQFQTSGTVNDFHIWVSRFYASGSAYGLEIDLLRRALDANHDYRAGISRLPRRAFYYHAWNSYPYGTNLLKAWPSVVITNEPSTDGYSSTRKFLPARTDISCAGADALVAGGDLFQQTSHGNEYCYMNLAFVTSDLFRLIAQQRACMIESCTTGDYGALANQHLFTRGGGCVLVVGGTEINYVNDFQTALPYGEAPKFRASLAAGESWGGALLKNYIFSARNRTVFFGDLSMPILNSPSNALPSVTNLVANPSQPTPGQPVTFTAAFSDPDAAAGDSPYVEFEHRVEWFPTGYDGGRANPASTVDTTNAGWMPFTYTYPTAGIFTVRVEVMDEWKARGWKEMSITVNSQPVPGDDAASVEANHVVAIPVLENDSDADQQALVLDAVVTAPAHGAVTRSGDVVVYASTSTWQGVDIFTYRVKDTLNGSRTGTVSVTVLGDATGPSPERAWSWGESNAVWVQFDEAVQAGAAPGGAENAASYSISYGAVVTSAQLQADARLVRLGTTPLEAGLDYVLAVTQVQDRAASPNAVAPNAAILFTHLPASVTAWVDDALPSGAAPVADNGDAWNWITLAPAPRSGRQAHQSNIYPADHQHYFQNATQTLAIATGDTLFAYVYLDPAHLPQEIMLQFKSASSWEHRAYWGQNLLPWGADRTVARTNLGALPPAGQWVRLEIPAASVGLQGATLDGMAFTLYGGRATWDLAGKFNGTFRPVVDADGDGLPDAWEAARFGSAGACDGTGDADQDGVSDADEYTAGTDPNRSDSVLATDCESPTGSTAGVTLAWPSVAGRIYSVLHGTNLCGGAPVAITTGLPATPPVNIFTGTLGSASGYYVIQAGFEPADP